MKPKRAIILAAGFGTRLLPLTREIPKPLLPVAGRPVLGRTLDLLRSWGVKEVLINLHHGADAMMKFLRDEKPGLRISLSYEPEILGTGGVLRKAAWFLDDKPFWMINADVVARLNPRPLLDAFTRFRPLAALWVTSEEGPRTVEVYRNGEIRTFRSKRPGGPETATFCGLHLLSPRILDYLPEEEVFASIIPAYEKAMAAGKEIMGVPVRGSLWADIGTPEQYLWAQAEWVGEENGPTPAGSHQGDPASPPRRGSAQRPADTKVESPPRRGQPRVSGAGVGAYASPSAKIDPSARLSNAIVLDRATLGPRARVSNAVIGPGVRLNAQAERLVVRGETGLDPEERDAVRETGWNPDDCAVEVLAPRGSNRTFRRILRGTQSRILIRYTPGRQENALYAGHSRFLEGIGFNVPAVLLDRPGDHLTIVEDMGRITLQDALGRAGDERCYRLYAEVVKQVAVMHGKGTQRARRRSIRLMPPFGPKLYAWEHTYFAERFLRDYLCTGAADRRAILQELKGVSRRLHKAPRVLIHRDLQSSNILLHKGRPAFIDFQGMRMGAAAYDLASLLCDPYMELSESLVERLLDHYYRFARSSLPDRGLFWFGAVERLAQALGAYGALGSVPATARFRKHIPAGLRMMQRALSRAGKVPRLSRVIAEAAQAHV